MAWPCRFANPDTKEALRQIGKNRFGALLWMVRDVLAVSFPSLHFRVVFIFVASVFGMNASGANPVHGDRRR
jgi:hypothetical protein